MFLKPYRVKR